MKLDPSRSVVRQAGPQDHQEVWRLLLQAHSENGIFRLSPQKVEFFVQRSLNPKMIPPWDEGPRGTIGVIGEEKLEALCFVTIGQFWYSDEYHIEELIAYVDPEYRHSDHSQALIKWMKDLAEDTDTRLLTGIMSTIRTEAKVRLYKRQLPQIGAFFLYPCPANVTNATNGHTHPA